MPAPFLLWELAELEFRGNLQEGALSSRHRESLHGLVLDGGPRGEPLVGGALGRVRAEAVRVEAGRHQCVHRACIQLSKRGRNLSSGLSPNPQASPQQLLPCALGHGICVAYKGWTVQVCGSKDWGERMDGEWELDE